MYFRKYIISILVVFLGFHICLKADDNSLPLPLSYNNIISDFGFGLDIKPVILPDSNMLFTVTLLGNGTYLSRFLGRDSDGSLLYDKPELLSQWSDKYGLCKTINLDIDTNLLFLTDKSTGYWGYAELDTADDTLRVSKFTLINVNGNPISGDFTIVKNNGNIYLLKVSALNDSTSYWPGGQDPWVYPANPMIGFNKGYDSIGNWLGDKTTTVVSCSQLIDRNTWTFGTYSQVLQNGVRFKLQAYQSPVRLGVVNLLEEDDDQILISWDVDQLSLFDMDVEDGKISFVERQLPVDLINSTSSIYFASDITSSYPLYKSSKVGFIMGGNSGVLAEYYYNGKVWCSRPVKMRGGDLHVETLAVPNWVDWDGDGIPDLIAGDASGYITFFKNTGTSISPEWNKGVRLTAAGEEIHHQAGLTGSIQGPNERRWGYTQPKVVDWDGDGLLDILCNDITGKYVFYKNIGTSTDPLLAKAVPLTYKGTEFKAAWRSKPAILSEYFLKVGDSHLPSMLAINGDGLLCLYTRSKSTPCNLDSQEYVLNTSGNPVRIVGFAGHEGRATLNICDFNQDGVWDILFGQGIHMYQSKEVSTARPYSTAYIMINKGTNENPRFDVPRAIVQANGIGIDMDRHGCWVDPILNSKQEITSMIAGGEDGRFYFFGVPQSYQSAAPISEN